MKVLHVSDNYPSLSHPDQGTFIYAQVHALARASADVHVAHLYPFHPLRSAPSDLPALQGGCERTQGEVTVTRHGYAAFPRQARWGRPDVFMYWALRRASQIPWDSVDVIHGHMMYPAGAAAVLLGAWARKPVVLTAHGSDVHTHPATNPRARRGLLRAAKGADAVVCVSDALTEQLRELSGVAAQTLYIGVNLNVFKPMPQSEAREHLGLEASSRYVLYVGHLHKAKGVHDLVAAFKTLLGAIPDAHLLLIGRGDRREILEQEVIAAGIQHAVTFVGAVPHHDVVTWMRAADVLALPSYGEGLPTVIVEAGALGLPVIASDVGGIPEIIQDGESGVLIRPGDVDALTGALLELLSSEDTRATYRAALSLRVNRCFDIDSNAHKLKELYRSLSSSQGASMALPGAGES